MVESAVTLIQSAVTLVESAATLVESAVTLVESAVTLVEHGPLPPRRPFQGLISYNTFNISCTVVRQDS